jgi:cobalt/nickel transport system permease protein
MHIPDGFLSPPVAASTAAASALSVAAALRRVRPEMEPGLAPRMGLTAAYVFAAQMVNFPVAGGTSGHLLGALLAAVLVGPHAATVAMTAVFLIQAFFFLDGGHTALGANILNMGLAGTYGGYAIYRLAAGPAPGSRRCLVAAAVAAWLSVMLGAALTSVELALSGTIAPRLVFPAMLGVHALIGLGEAAITVAAVGLLWKVRPDLLTGRDAAPGASGRWGWAAAGLLLVALLAPLASSSPDGLERVAGQLGFETHAAAPMFGGPFPDYSLPGLGESRWAPVAVSLIGCGLVLAAVALTSRLRGRASASSGTRVGRIDARVRLGCMLGLVLTAVLLPAEAAGKVVVLAAFAAAWTLAERVSFRWLAGRAVLLLPFVGLAALSSTALRSGFGAGFYGLVFLRAATSLLATAAFLGSTPEAEVLAAFRAYHLPPALAETVAFALRYLRALGEDTGRMLQARAARSAGAGTLALRVGVTGGIVGSLFIRSFERAERVSLAMAARGYRGGVPATAAGRLRPTDLAFGAGFMLFLMGIWRWQ